MLETICIAIGLSAIGLMVILAMIVSSPDFLTRCSRKEDPEWAKEYDKHLADFLRFKNQKAENWNV